MAAQNISLVSTVVETDEVTKSCENDKLTITRYNNKEKKNYNKNRVYFTTIKYHSIWATKLAL